MYVCAFFIIWIIGVDFCWSRERARVVVFVGAGRQAVVFARALRAVIWVRVLGSWSDLYSNIYNIYVLYI